MSPSLMMLSKMSLIDFLSCFIVYSYIFSKITFSILFLELSLFHLLFKFEAYKICDSVVPTITLPHGYQNDHLRGKCANLKGVEKESFIENCDHYPLSVLDCTSDHIQPENLISAKIRNNTETMLNVYKEKCAHNCSSWLARNC